MQITRSNISNTFCTPTVRARIIGLMLFLLILTACKKLVETNSPITSINEANVYTTDGTAAAVLTGIYINLSKNNLVKGDWLNGPGLTSLSLLPALSADELSLFSRSNEMLIGYYHNLLSGNNRIYTSFWKNSYNIIFTANSAIEGLMSSPALTAEAQQQLTGEARFIRAFCYFYLINLYGDVPLVTSTDYKVNALLPRAPKSQVWRQIITDLLKAQALLREDYVQSDARTFYTAGTEERVRPNKWTATALLARAYLYAGDWVNAEAQSTAVINQRFRYLLPPLNEVFLKNSKEAIWQLQPVNNGWNTEDARVFILPETGPSDEWPVYLSNHLLNSFETSDHRKSSWVGKYTDTTFEPDIYYYYAFKYRSASLSAPLTEYQIVLRLGEQYLIRAEARAQQGEINDAASDLNAIRSRAGLANTSATTKEALLEAILHERQVELFTEWGHRWLDLKRTNMVDAVMSIVVPQKGGDWSTRWQWYPLPLTDLERNPNLVQNNGY